MILLAACGDSVGNELALSAAPVLSHRGLTVPVIAAAGELLVEDDRVGRVQDLLLGAGYLWLEDSSSPFIHLVDTSSGNVVHSGGTAGAGPGEFLRVNTLSRGRNGTVWAFDWQSLRLSQLEPASSSQGLDLVRVLTLRDHLPGNLGRAYSFASGFLHFRAPVVALWDSSGVVVSESTFNFLPATLRPLQRRRALAGSGVCIHGDGQTAALRFANAGRILILDSMLVRTDARVPYPAEELVQVDEIADSVFFVDHRRFYRDCAFSDSGLFALFDGRRTGDVLPEETGAGWIHVFDMSGQLQLVYRLDHPVWNIEVSPDGRTIFGSSYDDVGIWRYRLPPPPS